MSTVAPAPIALAQRMKALEPSATLAMAAKAKEAKAKGKPVYDFTLGEPDFTTPAHICAAANAAMAAGHTHYTVASGLPELKAAVAKQYTDRHGLEYKANQVVISNGAKHSLHNVFTVLVNEGDEVVIPAPYWVSYAELVKLAGGAPVILPTTAESNFKLSPEALRKAITPRTKILLLCSPSNPTGTVYSPDELGALADVCIEHDLLVISDEIYDQLVYDDRPYASFPTVRAGLADRTVIVNGVSKSYAMTGWRIGWTLSPANVAAAMADLQSQETSNPCSISQYAAIAAVSGPQECVAEMKAAFSKRRAWVRDRIKSLPNVLCPEMDGAFYAFIGVQAYLGKSYNGKVINGTTEWCLELLAQQNVATVMGSAFGAEGFVRISYATSDEILAKGFDGIEAFLKSAK
ncbi:MAG TPA: pyridoxal phosphate-dependent aminotransferase [Pirellulales bacterium]